MAFSLSFFFIPCFIAVYLVWNSRFINHRNRYNCPPVIKCILIIYWRYIFFFFFWNPFASVQRQRVQHIYSDLRILNRNATRKHIVQCVFTFKSKRLQVIQYLNIRVQWRRTRGSCLVMTRRYIFFFSGWGSGPFIVCYKYSMLNRLRDKSSDIKIKYI